VTVHSTRELGYHTQLSEWTVENVLYHRRDEGSVHGHLPPHSWIVDRGRENTVAADLNLSRV